MCLPYTYYTFAQVIYLLVSLQRTSLVEPSRIIWFLWTSAEEMYTTQMQCVMLLSSYSNHTLVKLCFIERNTCSMVWGRSSCRELNPESLTWGASALWGLMVAWWFCLSGQRTHSSEPGTRQLPLITSWGIYFPLVYTTHHWTCVCILIASDDSVLIASFELDV